MAILLDEMIGEVIGGSAFPEQLSPERAAIEDPSSGNFRGDLLGKLAKRAGRNVTKKPGKPRPTDPYISEVVEELMPGIDKDEAGKIIEGLSTFDDSTSTKFQKILDEAHPDSGIGKTLKDMKEVVAKKGWSKSMAMVGGAAALLWFMMKGEKEEPELVAPEPEIIDPREAVDPESQAEMARYEEILRNSEFERNKLRGIPNDIPVEKELIPGEF